MYNNIFIANDDPKSAETAFVKVGCTSFTGRERQDRVIMEMMH